MAQDEGPQGDSRAEAVQKLAERITKDLADQGKLLEMGWQMYRLLCLKLAPHESADDKREAFLAGCEHTFSSLIAMQDEDREPTAADLARMNNMNDELEPVRRYLRLKYGRTAGSA